MYLSNLCHIMKTTQRLLVEDLEHEHGEWDQAISHKSRAIILISPHNPTGKLFNLSEMEHIAKNAISTGPQCVVISDEGYQYIIITLHLRKTNCRV